MQRGGLLDDADISNVNLAEILEDGVKIKIPINSDIEEVPIIYEKNEEIIEKNEIKNNTSKKMVNINKASSFELETLPGIGATLATKIVEYRNENGKFLEIQDIKNVNRDRKQ